MKVIWLAIWMLALPPTAWGLDPFYTDEQYKAEREAYKKRVPLTPARETHGFPLALKLETVRIPSLKLESVSPVEAVETLRQKSVEAEPSFGGVSFMLDSYTAAEKGTTVSLDLKDVPLVEALRYVTEISGCGFTVQQGQIQILSRINSFSYWRRPSLCNLLISDELAQKWFPEAEAKDEGDSGPIWKAEPVLEPLGVPFWQGTQADYVPSLNALSIIHSQMGVDCLRIIVTEAEAEVRLKGVKAGQLQAPDGMKLISLPVPDAHRTLLKTVMLREEGLLSPIAATTEDLLKERGVTFPKGAAAHWESKAEKLHLLQTEPNVEAIRKLLE